MNTTEQLIDKYMNGTTTCAEEEQLRAFFTSPESIIPDDLQWMKALFGYEREELSAQQPAPRRTHWGWKAAAAVAAVLVSAAALLSLPSPQRSYAMIDGQRTTNRQVIQDEALQALNMVSATDEETFDALFQ